MPSGKSENCVTPAQMKLINSGESLVTAFLTTPRPVRCIIDGLGIAGFCLRWQPPQRILYLATYDSYYSREGFVSVV